MPADILQTGISWRGADVYVFGSGPSALEGVYAVPDGALCIATNKAILLDAVFTHWLCATPKLLELPWFNTAMDSVLEQGQTYPIVRFGALVDAYPDVPYYFHPGPSLWSNTKRSQGHAPQPVKGFGCMEGYLRGGASAPARAMQLAWFAGAKRCILGGCDLKGYGYFDGTVNEYKYRTMDKAGYWAELPYFQLLIEWVKSKGMDVVSLRPTPLDVVVLH